MCRGPTLREGDGVTRAPRVSDDQAASLDDITTAMEQLSPVDRVRLERYARRRVDGLPSRAVDGSDLLQAAVLVVLEGRRRWNPAKVDFVRFLIGAMKSISSRWYAKSGLGRGVTLEADLPHADVDDDSPIDRFPNASPTAEDAHIAAEERREAQRCVENAYETLGDDPVSREILDGFIAGMTRAEIREALDLPKHEWEAAWKRILRKTRGVATKGNGDA